MVQRWSRGRAWGFLCLIRNPHHPLFIRFLRNKFRGFASFVPHSKAFFFEKFPEIFSTFSKSKKIIVFVPKLVQNHYIDQNLAKFYLKTTKNCRFFLKNLHFFKIFAAFGGEICASFMVFSARFCAREPTLRLEARHLGHL